MMKQAEAIIDCADGGERRDAVQPYNCADYSYLENGTMNKAPEGATHYSPRDECFYQKRDGSWYPLASGIPTELSVYASRAFLAQLVPVDSVPPLWDGSGLPPVGVECEAWYDDGKVCWHRADVIGHSPYEPKVIAVSLKGDHERKLIWCHCFRPIKTPEQLAAEQRERAIVDMCQRVEGSVAKWNINIDCSAAMRAVVEALYDAGARLPE